VEPGFEVVQKALADIYKCLLDLNLSMGATGDKFPGDQTFYHLDKVAVRLVHFLFSKWSDFGCSLGVLRGC